MSSPSSSSSSSGNRGRRPARPLGSSSVYVGVPAAAAYLDVDPKTVRSLIARGRLPAYRLDKRLIKIKIADLDRLLTPMSGGAA